MEKNVLEEGRGDGMQGARRDIVLRQEQERSAHCNRRKVAECEFTYKQQVRSEVDVWLLWDQTKSTNMVYDIEASVLQSHRVIMLTSIAALGKIRQYREGFEGVSQILLLPD